ncbi:hypothetical protein ACIRU8_39185 [Streptomyces sp. NPDC101175]|uniref:hypothetical protein n=1 Tax=Streptomyces sp. NPDC101175 TaxID=3366123 RepID=UPI003835902B
MIIPEALDALHVLIRAGLIWLVVLAGAAGVAVYATVVVPCAVAWDALTRALAASRAYRAWEVHGVAPAAVHDRLAPSWARGGELEEAA